MTDSRARFDEQRCHIADENNFYCPIERLMLRLALRLLLQTLEIIRAGAIWLG